MMIMPSNNLSGVVHYFAGAYPGRIGMLMSPAGWRIPPWYMPYGLDNGCFLRWDPDAFFHTLRRAKLVHPPLWVCVPDKWSDAETTFRRWRKWKDRVKAYGFPLAFCVQDGMEPQDVPVDAYCAFIGGSDQWREKSAHRFKGVVPWLHIGRLSKTALIPWALEIGADSIDSTGFFRARDKRYQGFIEFFEGEKQMPLFS